MIESHVHTPATGVGRGLVALLVALALSLAPLGRVAVADPRGDARAHYQKGKAAFDAGDFKGAIAEFTAADRLAPSPLLHFNIGLCHEQLGDAPEALRRYRLYVAAMPEAPNRAAVDEKIRALAAKVGSADDPTRADRPLEPPLDGAPPAPSAPPTAAAPPVGAATGDPGLDRAAAVDVARVRQERGAPSAPSPAAPSAPSPDTAGSPAVAAAPREAAAEPVYKQWWFWVVLGVGALVVINIAASDPDDDGTRALVLPPPGAGPRTVDGGGATLFRF